MLETEVSAMFPDREVCHPDGATRVPRLRDGVGFLVSRCPSVSEKILRTRNNYFD